MYTSLALVVVATASYAVARPSVPTEATSAAQEPTRVRLPLPLVPRDYFAEYLLPRFLMPHLQGYEESPRVRLQPMPRRNDWLNKEIERITQMANEREPMSPYNEQIMSQLVGRNPYLEPFNPPARRNQNVPTLVVPKVMYERSPSRPNVKSLKQAVKRPKTNATAEDKKAFAFTPTDKGFFDSEIEPSAGTADRPQASALSGAMPARTIRQNPNLSRNKALVAEDLDKLRIGLGIGHELGTTVRPKHVQMTDMEAHDPAESIYGVALIAAIGAAITMAVLGFAFGWYTLSKKAKAAADVDYPAYGVTGPTVDSSGDRRLAQSAHMYHYQHQKQQIIAMERNGLEHNGSVSDPESEEENEEGDYTVYECPGFATTGDMEVKNPLFNEDPTPSTPGKCAVMKTQSKE